MDLDNKFHNPNSMTDKSVNTWAAGATLAYIGELIIHGIYFLFIKFPIFLYKKIKGTIKEIKFRREFKKRHKK